MNPVDDQKATNNRLKSKEESTTIVIESQSRKFMIMIILSALGGVSSVAVGYAGSFLSFVPLGPVSGQLLAGLHVFWLVLVAALIRSGGAATTAGALKGIIELLLPNHLGAFVLLISLLEGVVVDLSLLPFKRASPVIIFVASGLSSASNIVVLQVFQILPPNLPLAVYAAMYSASFMSGLLLGGYLSLKTLNVIKRVRSV
jgi:ABC-type thiamin/hydroxymethylpyrimidine transport system permease subunit